MKRTLLLLVPCLMCIGCRRAAPVAIDNPAHELLTPLSVPFNTKEGYTLNPFFHDSVQPSFHSADDSLATGRPYAVSARAIDPAKVEKPVRRVALKPISRRVYNNLHPLSTTSRVVHLSPFPLHPSAKQYHLINSNGDTIPSGQLHPVPTVDKICQFPQPQPALPATNRYDAIHNIQHIDVDHGLLLSNVGALVMDRNQQVWIGLYGGGLARYDGTSFTNFTKTNGLPNNFIHDILQDRAGNIWVATDGGGVCRFDGERFFHYTEKNGMATALITCLEEDVQGNIWIGTLDKGVSCIIPGKSGNADTLIHYSGKDGLLPISVFDIESDAAGNIWVASGARGAFRCRFTTSHRIQDVEQFSVADGLPGNKVFDILISESGAVWFSTNTGVCQLDLETSGTQGLCTYYQFPTLEPIHYIRSMYEDKQHHIWFGTNGDGMLQLQKNRAESSSYSFYTVYGVREGLPHGNIRSITEDTFGNIWFGTVGSGIGCIKSRRITHIGKNEGLTDFAVNAIREDWQGDIWLGTQGDGLYQYVPGNGQQIAIANQFTTTEGLPSNLVSAIETDSSGNVWLGTAIGLCHLQQGTFTSYLPANGLSHSDVLSICIDQRGNIWVGTNGGGITLLVGTDQSVPLMYHLTEEQGLLDNIVRDIRQDDDGRMWFATREGVSVYVPSHEVHRGMITHYTEKEGLPFKTINALHKDGKGHIWLGSGAGIVRHQNAKDTMPEMLIHFGYRSRTLNSTIRSICEDPDGNIWFSSEGGINIITTGNELMPAHTTRYSKLDGLKSNNFLRKSALIDARKYGWWGNVQGGVELLRLDDFKPGNHDVIPSLRSIEINERYVDFHNMPDSLAKAIRFSGISNFYNCPSGLSLRHTHNNLVFHFAAIDWSAPSKIKYSYRMEGLSDTWSQPTGETKAVYRSLPYGHYTFRIKARSESHEWSESAAYNFTIKPPWWLSWWAFTTYGLLGTTLIYGTYRFQLNQQLMQAEKKRLVELDRVKNRMYANITHEFRTPLTLIHGPVSQALHANVNLDKRDIQSIYRQSERLQQLINQMLELQKLEAGKVQPDYAYGEIIQVIRYLFSSFEPWAREKNISMIFSSSLQEVFMDVDQEKLTQIISNLLSNAIKHTPRNGKVATTVSTSPFADFLSIAVHDTGVGISAEDLPHIFDRYYQSNRAASGGTGIGLALAKNLTELMGGTLQVESTIEAGSTFRLSLPISKRSTKPLQPPVQATISFDDSAIAESSFGSTEQIETGKPIILVIEDHPEIAQYVGTCLSAEHVILTALNGNDGLKMAYEHIPDLIISDVMMPGKNGFELTQQLKTDILTSHIPIILLTGRGDHEGMMEGIEHGSDAYVVKPFDPQELKLRVRKLLELRANLSAYYRQYPDTGQPPSVQASAKENEFMQRLRTAVEEHSNDAQFNMTMLSRLMAMSHPQLHRKVTALTGESVGKFVRAIRLRKAVELLRNSDLTIAEVAYESGFSEPGYFTKIFSKEYNMTPSEFRNTPGA